MFFRKKKRRIVLETRKLRYGYRDKDVLKGIDLSVKAGTILALIGPSGSGKSTLLKILTGELKKRKGVVKKKRRFLFPLPIGYVPQELALLPNLTLRENVRIFGNLYGLSGKEAEKRGIKLASMLNMRDLMDRRIKNMSGGQRVRANVMCSVLHDPTIILADEPFTGLDFNNRILLWKFLLKMKKKGKAIVLTTHNLNEAEKFCDEIVILKQGRVLVKGKPSFIREKLRAGLWLEIVVKGSIGKFVGELQKICEKNDMVLVVYDSSRFAVMMKDENERKKVESVLRKAGVEFEIVEARVPTLDEIFLKVGS